jgi:hypothetical protein
MFSKITRVIVIIVAWLIALSLVYLFILKLQLLRNIFQ